jgi:mitochondrial import inner membrane translocase subunit TIM9
MNKMVQNCFESCIDDFSTKSLGSREEACLGKCFEKVNAGQQRVGMRFQEANELFEKTGSFTS